MRTRPGAENIGGSEGAAGCRLGGGGVRPVDSEQLVCQRDGAPTRLRCAGCEAGICPACLVRTPVGCKCPGCAGARAGTGRRSRAGHLLLGGAAVLALLGAVALLRTSDEATSTRAVVETSVAGAPATRQAMIGEEARDGQLVFIVEEFACAAKEASPAGGTATGGKLCSLRFTVKNASTSPAMLLGRFQYLVDPQSKTYGADDALTRAVLENGNRSLSELNINPEVVVPLLYVFDLPDTVDPIEAQFRGTGRSRFGISVRLQRRA